ncbi:MAG: IMPACT family protein [Oscillospiraceae bacterium]|nr:IMPACT family protein [Oscillospiraceae bacterium]
MKSYATIEGAAEAELVEKRSRFLSLASPVRDEGEASLLLSQIRARRHDASHHCYAYILRAGGIRRYSDDGEPSGTAGMPILEVLRRRGLSDTMVTVTRYFGGVLLGAGGLTRAYSQSAALCLDSAVVLDMRPCAVITLTVPYSLYGKLKNILPAYGVKTLADSFGEEVSLTLRLEKDRLPALCGELSELTAGAVRPLLLREEFAPL